MVQDSSATPAVVHQIEGRFAIVVSRYHGDITGSLLRGAQETLVSQGVSADAIEVLWVPGAWELVSGTQFALQTGRFAAVLTLGCVIRGETTHDQYINAAVSDGLMRLSLDHQLPVAFGLLTCNTREQAEARAGGAVGNKGEEVAQAAVQMLLLRSQLMD